MMDIALEQEEGLELQPAPATTATTTATAAASTSTVTEARANNCGTIVDQQHVPATAAPPAIHVAGMARRRSRLTRRWKKRADKQRQRDADKQQPSITVFMKHASSGERMAGAAAATTTTTTTCATTAATLATLTPVGSRRSDGGAARRRGFASCSRF